MSNVVPEAKAKLLTRSQSDSQSEEFAAKSLHRTERPEVTYCLVEKRADSVEKPQGHQ